MKTLALACALLLTASVFAQTPPAPPAKKLPVGSPHNPFKIADLAFMSGRWITHFKTGGMVAELICSDIRMQQMMCQFRLNSPDKWMMYEFYSVRQTPNGVEEIGRIFDSQLSLGKEDQRTLLYPIQITRDRVMLAGPEGGVVQSSSLDLKRDAHGKVTAMHGHIVHTGGVIDVDWERLAFDARVK